MKCPKCDAVENQIIIFEKEHPPGTNHTHSRCDKCGHADIIFKTAEMFVVFGSNDRSNSPV